MKNIFFVVLVFTLFSCESKRYVFINQNYKTGVDFRTGKWLLNEIDSDKKNQEALTLEAIKSLQPNLKERLVYIKDAKAILISKKTNINPTKTKLKELKDGTGFDFFINIKAQSKKSQLKTVEIYNSDSPGKNQSEVILEIYDLNSKEIIYSKKVIGTDSKSTEKSIWETKKSDKLIDNIHFYKSNKKLMLGSLKKILKDLTKKSLVN